MNNRFKNTLKLIIMILFFTISTFGVGYKKADAVINNKEVTNISSQKTFAIKNDVVFRGVFSSHSWYFNINKWWSVNSVDLDFNFNINQILGDNAKAYLTFSVNGVPFKSQEIKYKDHTSNQEIKLKIPNNLIKEGSNQIKVESYSRISDLPCVDDVNNANWLTINKGTNVTVKFNRLRANNILSNFPYPFIQIGDEEKSDNQIVIPDNYTNNEIADAMMLSNYLGGIEKDYKYNGTIVKYSDMDKNKNTIFIGLYDALPKELKDNVSESLGEDTGVLKLIKSPYTKEDNTQVLIITSKGESMLEKATRTMMNKNIVKQLDMDEYKVTTKDDELDKLQDNTDKIYFKDLIGDNILLKGPFRRSANLGYKFPKNKVLANGGRVALDFRYSQNLDFDKSLVTVYINGDPIGSKKLSLEKSNGDSVVFNIPNDIKSYSYLNIEVAFDLEMKNTWCEKREEETPWAYVTGNSYLYLPTKDNLDYYFNQYPNPFVKDRNLNDILLVIPQNVKSSELTNIGNLFSYIGSDVEYNRGSITVESGDKVSDAKQHNNIIVYGTPQNNQFIREINNDLWFKYKDEFSAFDSNAKEFLTSPYNKEIATFQLSISPFNEQRAMLVMTSPNETILANSMKYLTTDDIYKLTGDSAIIDEYGNVTNFKMKKEKNQKPVYEKIKSSSTIVKGLMGLLVLLFILIIISVTLYINKYKKDDNHEKEKKEIKRIFKK